MAAEWSGKIENILACLRGAVNGGAEKMAGTDLSRVKLASGRILPLALATMKDSKCNPCPCTLLLPMSLTRTCAMGEDNRLRIEHHEKRLNPFYPRARISADAQEGTERA